MTQSVHDVYEVNLASSGKLKLRAKGLLAKGGDDNVFEACVLLHEAARIQQRATRALPTCPPQTKLASAAEECWCYVEGLDPPGAAEVWGRVLHAQQQVDGPTADAILARLKPRFELSQRAFATALNASPSLLATRHARTLAPASSTNRRAASAELTKVLRRFPGMPSFWWARYRLAEPDKKLDAWEALSRARRLSPDDSRFLATSLLVAAWALPPAEAERHIATVRGSLEHSGAEVCLMYAFSELTLARATPAQRRQRWQRALEAAQAGLAQAESEGLRKNLKAAQMLLQALLAGREPKMDILYLAGLGDLAVESSANADVTELLTARLLAAA